MQVQSMLFQMVPVGREAELKNGTGIQIFTQSVQDTEKWAIRGPNELCEELVAMSSL